MFPLEWQFGVSSFAQSCLCAQQAGVSVEEILRGWVKSSSVMEEERFASTLMDALVGTFRETIRKERNTTVQRVTPEQALLEII